MFQEVTTHFAAPHAVFYYCLRRFVSAPTRTFTGPTLERQRSILRVRSLPLQIIFPPSHTLALRYFNGDTGEGIGASHQTGWTALVASLIGEPKDETVTGAGASPAPSLHTDVVY